MSLNDEEKLEVDHLEVAKEAGTAAAVAGGAYVAAGTLINRHNELGTDALVDDEELTLKSNSADVKNEKIESIESEPDSDTITYRRIQGGTPPNASRRRIEVSDDGKILIENKQSNLNVSVGNSEHAEYFLSKRGDGAEIVEFDIPKWLDDFVGEEAIPQKGYRLNVNNQGGSAPKIVDPTTPEVSYELPAPWIEWLEEYATNGKIVKK